MDKEAILREILRWSIEDRILLVHIVADSISAENRGLSDAERNELRRRIEEYRRDPSIGIGAEDVFDKIERSLDRAPDRLTRVERALDADAHGA